MSNYYPPNDQNTNKVWEKIENPETAGWDGEKLQKLLLYLGRKSTSNFIILHNGKIVCEKRWELSQVTCRQIRRNLGKITNRICRLK